MAGIVLRDSIWVTLISFTEPGQTGIFLSAHTERAASEEIFADFWQKYVHWIRMAYSTFKSLFPQSTVCPSLPGLFDRQWQTFPSSVSAVLDKSFPIQLHKP